MTDIKTAACGIAKKRIAIIGGGPAGLMAAGVIADLGMTAVIFERNPKPGMKLGITGKGRCNLTNNCTAEDFIANVPTNPKFLYGAINSFTPADTMKLVEGLGVPLKTERGNRVFPVSDKASDIVRAFTRYSRCDIIHERVEKLILTDGSVTGLTAAGKDYPFDAVIVATGGVSYPKTGSTGDGYRFAEEAGLKVKEPKPALAPLETAEEWCPELQGLSLKNISVKVIREGAKKPVYEDFGELMFTHFGLTGPVILSASSHIKTDGKHTYSIRIDLKPALDEKTLDKRLLSDFTKYANRDFSNALDDLLPKKLIPIIIRLSGIEPTKKVNLITREERAVLLSLLKGLTLTITKMRPVDEAIVTSGGVAVSEIDPKTMAAKRVPGLYFAGEVIDVDAYTGGFNLQIAFSTANLAARAACEYVCQSTDETGN
nr:NAD(P)/FAD-dependent oxidoreductase [Clostridia bacterium]